MIATRNQNKKKSKGRPTVADARRLSKAVTVKFSKTDYETLKKKYGDELKEWYKL